MKEIKLSFDQCCGGPKSAKIEVYQNLIIIKDGYGKKQSFNQESFYRFKNILGATNKIPNNYKNKIYLTNLEIKNLIAQNDSDLFAQNILINKC